MISLRPDPPGSYPPTTNSVHVHCGTKHANCMSRFSQWEADALNVNKFLLIRTADSAVYRYDIRQRKKILKTWRGFNSCLKSSNHTIFHHWIVVFWKMWSHIGNCVQQIFINLFNYKIFYNLFNLYAHRCTRYVNLFANTVAVMRPQL